MRKIFVFVFIILLCLSFTFLSIKIERSSLVFYENKNSYDVYVLDVSRENINTYNIDNYFDDLKILEIVPYINPIYKKLFNFSSYSFNTVLSNKKNVSLFISNYLNILNKNGLNDELVKYNINGVKIIKVKVYASNNDIKYLLNNYNLKIVK